MTTPLDQTARDAFAATFGGAPTALARAPGRVELLGNHTDYNGGLVLAAAIDRYTVVVGRAVAGRQARVRSVNLDQVDEFDLDALEPGPPGSWGRYVRGVCWAHQERFGPLTSGFDAVIAGDVPLGGGLSSSASVQGAVALFLRAAGLLAGAGRGPLDDPARMALAHLLRRSENEFVGVGSGLLDQFSSLFGRSDRALTLDCRSLEYDRVPLGSPAPAIVVCDSKTSRRLADGMYNRRREECERAVAFFQSLRGAEAVRQLRDVTLDDLRAHWGELDPVGRLRARHVLAENERVRRGAEALRAGDVAAFGRLMSESHASSRDDFANSSPALDALIAAAGAAPGFLGGKLSGAGWAGCTVNLVAAECADAFAEAVRTRYARDSGSEPDVHVCRAAEGAAAQTPTG
ncbi:MAG TPA: galactokinase [Isosphaeraceae bacterium]|jgi:galactokinase